MLPRILRLIAGVPAILLGAFLGLFALVGFFAEPSGGMRAKAIALATIATLLVVVGTRLCRSRSKAKLLVARPLPERPRRKTGFSKAEMQTVGLCAQRLADVIYESMKLAKDSKNAETKRRRLRFAKEKLEEITALADDYPFLELPNLPNIENSIAQLEVEFEQAGYREIAEGNPPGEVPQPEASAPAMDSQQDEFWAHKVRRLKKAGCSDEVIRESRRNIPYPAAFREIGIAIRTEIRAGRKANADTPVLLSTLYQWAVIENFFTRIEWNKVVNERILFPTARSCIKGIKTPYKTIGYANLSLLNKTDVKWLIEAFGEPDSHSTAQDANPELWQRAVEAFGAAAKRDEQEFYRSHGFDGPPMIG